MTDRFAEQRAAADSMVVLAAEVRSIAEAANCGSAGAHPGTVANLEAMDSPGCQPAVYAWNLRSLAHAAPSCG